MTGQAAFQGSSVLITNTYTSAACHIVPQPRTHCPLDEDIQTIHSPCPSWHAWGWDFMLQELHQNLLHRCGAQCAYENWECPGKGVHLWFLFFHLAEQDRAAPIPACTGTCTAQDRFYERGFLRQCQTLELGFSDWMDGTAMRLKRS